MRMAKKKRGLCLPPWASAAPGGDERRFIQLGVSLLDHPKFIALKPGDQILYIRMKQHADPRPEFEMPRQVYAKFTDSKAFANSLEHLVSAGFVEVVANNYCIRKPNVYRFSTRWKE